VSVTPDPDLKIPGYRILRELGRGGMARVYLAMQESMEREVAIKVMLPALSAADSNFSDRFLREARIVAQLSHPHIIAVIDVGVAGPHHYYSMEYHTGGDLKARIHQGIMPKVALSIIRQVASALAFAHSKGYVHRDVKPENVIFRRDGTALLTDFGIAKASDGVISMTATGAIMGTPHYMSPEQAQGAELDHRSDLYSLGVMLYEMLTGGVPFTGTSALSIGIKHLKEPVPTLPPPLNVYQPLFDRLLAKEPEQRFQSGEELLTAIDAMSSGNYAAVGIATQPAVVPSRTSGTHAKTQVSGAQAQTVVTGAPVTAGTGRRRGFIITVAVLVPLVAAGGYILLRPATIPMGPQVTIPAASAPFADSKINQLSMLLTEADLAALAGRYLEPRDQSAVHKYRQVLDLDAGNVRATRGLQEIAKHYIAQVDQALNEKNFDNAATSLKQAEAADPANPLLATRRQALHEARSGYVAPPVAAKSAPAAKKKSPKPAPAPVVIAPTPPPVVVAPRVNEAQERERMLINIFARMQALLSPGSLTATRAVLATELYAEATKLAPSDARVRNAPDQIADAYLKLATLRADSKDYPEADKLIRKGLDLVPNHRMLVGLQKDIAERQKTKPRSFGTF